MTVPRWLERARNERSRRRRRRRLRLMAALALAADAIPVEREGCILRHRLDWDVHKQTLLLEGQFQRCYRMSAESFERLLSFIGPALVRDELQSRRRTGTDPISPEIMLQMTISWLAGSSYHTTRNLGGTSVTAIYDAMHAVMDAICHCTELIIRAPTESAKRMYELADGFTAISKDSVLTGCVGCIDGWLCEIRAPSAREVPDVAAFYSGHYQKYGLNVQAICDSLCRFTGYCFNSPGKVGDSIAFKKWKLREAIMQLPAGFYIIGDNAYPLSDSLLVPFSKLELKSKAHSDYNFYLSQLRIRIEMAFGLLVNKWQIFKRPLVVDFVNVKKVIKTCMKLHNFCIDERTKTQDASTSMRAITTEYHTLPESWYHPTDNSDDAAALRPDAQGRILRDVIMNHIQTFNLRRPRAR